MLNRKRLTFVILILMIMVSVRFLPGCGQGLKILTEISSGGTGVDWSQWTYRRSITISNSGTAQTDYQVNIKLNNINFVFANADPDGDDIRFNLNGTSLSYWIESWDSIGETASVWVKIPSIAASGNTVIYQYYGNTGLTPASDFDNTFTKESGFTGLAAQWHMDEGSGTSIADSSGNSNAGTFSGVTWVIPGADGGCWYDRVDVNFITGESIQTNASTNYINVSDNSSLDALDKITISFWFKANAVVSGYMISKGNTVDGNLSYSVFLNASRIWFYTSLDGSSFNPLQNNGSTISSAQWYHFAAVYDGTVPTQKIYINGSARGENIPVEVTLLNSSSDLIICNQKAGVSNYFNGIIDEVSIYNTALTPDQIKALSQRRKDSPDVGDTPVVGIEEAVP